MGDRMRRTGCFRMLSSMFNKAKEWGILPDGAPNPASRIQRFKEKSRDRFVTLEELPRLVDAIEAEPSPYVRAAFHLFLRTGLRRSELAELEMESSGPLPV